MPREDLSRKQRTKKSRRESWRGKSISKKLYIIRNLLRYIINSARNCISSRRSLVYHHCESFFWCTLRVMIYSPDGLLRYNTALPCWWYAIAFAMDKTIRTCFRKSLLSGGQGWIRTIEVVDGRFTVCSLWPLGNLPILWSWWTDSNPRPADYKSAALPTELHQLIAVCESFSTRLDYYISKISICQHFFTIFSIIKRLTLKKESLINLS